MVTTGSKGSANTGSNPVRLAMSKRYSESLVQDLNNELAECLRREWDILGIKESDTPPPSSVDRFLCGKTLMKKYQVGFVPKRKWFSNSQRNPLKSTHPKSQGEAHSQVAEW